MKTCTKCRREYLKSEFNLDGSTSDGYSCWCKHCRREYSRKKYQENKDRERLIKAEYYLKNKDKILDLNKEKRKVETLSDKLKRREYSLKRYFGISLKQYDELREKQDHKCPICLGELEKEKYSYPVDHAHTGPNAGKIRAILHDKCNRFVMWRHDNADQLRRAADLIDNPLTDWVVPEDFVKGRKKKRKKNRIAKTINP